MRESQQIAGFGPGERGDRRCDAPPASAAGRRRGEDRVEKTETTTAETSADTDGSAAEILDALSEHDGHLEQQEFPSVTDLSQSTISRQLIALEEQDAVRRYTIGRRKLVFLPGAEPPEFQTRR